MKYTCDCCYYNTERKCNFDKHLLSAKHILAMNNAKKVATNYTCNFCDFSTSKKSNYTNHLLTAKHIAAEKVAKVATTGEPSMESTHSELCSPNDMQTVVSNNHNLIINLLKQNNDLQKQIIELSKEPKIINNNYTTNSGNTNNNQFNLSLFLNETCKHALNFTEFIENIQVTYDDLENNAKMGFVGGMTKIIVDNLKQLDLNNRPIHCTDAKRETIYVKEEDQWEKDGSKDIIQTGIQEITRKNMCQLSEWRENNPEYNDMDTETGEKSIVLQQNLMAGGKRSEFYPKIIKNIAKETILDKKILIE